MLVDPSITTTGDGGPAVAPDDRRAKRHAATRAEILDAAWALARQEGLGTLSMRDLAAAVGMRAPSLYQYFSSKLGIYDAMFGQGMRAASEAVGTAMAAHPGVDGLREAARTAVEFSVSDPVRAQLLFWRTIPGFEPSPESYVWAQQMSGHVRDRMDELGVDDPDALDLFTGLIAGLVSQQLANDPGGDRWLRLVDRTVDMFLAGVGLETGRPPHKSPQKKQSKSAPRKET